MVPANPPPPGLAGSWPWAAWMQGQWLMALEAMGHIVSGPAGGRAGPLGPRTAGAQNQPRGVGCPGGRQWVLERPGGTEARAEHGFVFLFSDLRICLCPQRRLPARSLI